MDQISMVNVKGISDKPTNNNSPSYYSNASMQTKNS